MAKFREWAWAVLPRLSRRPCPCLVPAQKRIARWSRVLWCRRDRKSDLSKSSTFEQVEHVDDSAMFNRFVGANDSAKIRIFLPCPLGQSGDGVVLGDGLRINHGGSVRAELYAKDGLNTLTARSLG